MVFVNDHAIFEDMPINMKRRVTQSWPGALMQSLNCKAVGMAQNLMEELDGGIYDVDFADMPWPENNAIRV
jgi:hypothetical protein